MTPSPCGFSFEPQNTPMNRWRASLLQDAEQALGSGPQLLWFLENSQESSTLETSTFPQSHPQITVEHPGSGRMTGAQQPQPARPQLHAVLSHSTVGPQPDDPSDRLGDLAGSGSRPGSKWACPGIHIVPHKTDFQLFLKNLEDWAILGAMTSGGAQGPPPPPLPTSRHVRPTLPLSLPAAAPSLFRDPAWFL